MSEQFRITSLLHDASAAEYPLFCAEQARKVRDFHRTFPMYSETPLVSMPKTAELLGLGNIYIKDESKRFGLNAFKVLGGSYAIGYCLAKKLGVDPDEISFDILTSDETREKIKDITCITATDGNHGRGVAWTAN